MKNFHIPNRSLSGLVLVAAALAGSGCGGGGDNNPTPANQAPTVPTALEALGLSSSRVDLSWAASTDADGIASYKVLRAGVEVASVTTGTQYADKGLSASTSYTYAVRACDTKGLCSADSSAATASTTALLPNVDLTNTPSTAEAFVALGSNSAAGDGVAYTGAALKFGPMTLSGMSGSPVAVAATGDLAAYISITVNGKTATASTTVGNGDVVSAALDLAGYTSKLVSTTGKPLAYNTLYLPQIRLGTTTITLGTSPVGAGILTCSSPLQPPAAANTPCS